MATSDISISAYIPCYNGAETLARAIASIKQQTIPIAELFVIDDGSTDNSAEIAECAGARVISMGTNSGRGAVRRRAMLEAAHELVLCCDSSKFLSTDFAERARAWFEDPLVAAVSGWIQQIEATNAVERWRGRHLFKMDHSQETGYRCLITGGAMVRKSAVLQVGNFDAQLRHSEDLDLGQRLIEAGFKVANDPQLSVISCATNDLWEVLERYWRWHAGVEPKMDLASYGKQILYSVRVLAVEDLKDGDPVSAMVSLLSPHYQYWKTQRAMSVKHR